MPPQQTATSSWEQGQGARREGQTLQQLEGPRETEAQRGEGTCQAHYKLVGGQTCNSYPSPRLHPCLGEGDCLPTGTGQGKGAQGTSQSSKAQTTPRSSSNSLS